MSFGLAYLGDEQGFAMLQATAERKAPRRTSGKRHFQEPPATTVPVSRPGVRVSRFRYDVPVVAAAVAAVHVVYVYVILL